MQQTEKYQLNLIETSDPFSPAPLNENAQKTEAAIAAEAQARAAGDAAANSAIAAETAARQSADAGLMARVATLESHKVLAGKYQGNGRSRTSGDRTVVSQTIQIGIDPIAVIVYKEGTSMTYIGVAGYTLRGSGDFDVLTLIPGGFKLEDGYGSITLNGPFNYYYIAIG